MPTYTFDFDLDLWVRGLEIEADSYEEALEKLNSMSAEDIVSDGYVANKTISDVDYDVDEEEEPEEDEDEEEFDPDQFDDVDIEMVDEE